MKILFLSKRKPFAEDAAQLLRGHFPETEVYFGERGDPFPESVRGKTFDYVISYICPWIVPEEVLSCAKISAVNFHPGPPEYPGIGCTNFAIYDEKKEYGVTVHLMDQRVDTGAIIQVERFPIFEKDTVYSLTQRCYAYLFIAFIGIFPRILQGKKFPPNGEQWSRKPFTRRELNDLCRLNKDMTPREIELRKKATDFPGMPGAYWEPAQTQKADAKT